MDNNSNTVTESTICQSSRLKRQITGHVNQNGGMIFS